MQYPELTNPHRTNVAIKTDNVHFFLSSETLLPNADRTRRGSGSPRPDPSSGHQQLRRQPLQDGHQHPRAQEVPLQRHG